MKQSKLMSLIESIGNIAVGFMISVCAQAVFLPLLGVPIPWSANFAFAAVMTLISVARSFLMRRLFEALHIRRPLSPFMQAVIAERFRQVEVEGWTHEHDDIEHEPGVLAAAGAAYAIGCGVPDNSPPPRAWPWDRRWWKPQGIRRDLVRAGALIIAEGEKFDRGRKRRGGEAARGAHVPSRRGDGTRATRLRGAADPRCMTAWQS